MTTSTPGSTGSFTYDPRSETWSWSEQVFEIYGFRPGDVVPSSDLIASHLHPDDRDHVLRLLAEAADHGRPFSVWHRIVDAQGGTRQVTMVCATGPGGDGEVTAVSGYLVDLTEAVRRTTSREVEQAMESVLESRPVIEQAKGALMLAYSLDAESAFALLRRYSQNVNVKLRDVARSVVESLPSGRLPALDEWDGLVEEITEG